MESAKQEEAHNSPKDNGFSKKPFGFLEFLTTILQILLNFLFSKRIKSYLMCLVVAKILFMSLNTSILYCFLLKL